MRSFPVFPYYRPRLPVTSGRDDVISGFYADSERSEPDAEKLMVRDGQYAYPMAYVTEHQSALPDAKPDSEMG